MTSITYPDKTKSSYVYDAKGRVIKETAADGSEHSYVYDALGNVTKISYDIYGNVWKVTDAYGNIVKESTYDAINQLIQVKNKYQNRYLEW